MATQRWFTGPVGRLDARVHGQGRPVLLLHPHPLFGGTMGSRLVYHLAEALARAGFQAVRFDFRGVGRSEGAYAMGLGEVEDAEAVLDDVGASLVVGYSFGGAVALRLAAERDIERAVLVATPGAVTSSHLTPLQDARHARAPAHLIAGHEDPYVPAAVARRLLAALPEGSSLDFVPGGHFLSPEGHDEVAGRVVTALLPHR